MSDNSTPKLKFDHTAISAIVKMISPLGENELLNEYTPDKSISSSLPL